MFFDQLESKSSSKIGLRMYIEDYDSMHQGTYLTAANILVDTFLGEKSSTIDIGHIEIASLKSISDKEVY